MGAGRRVRRDAARMGLRLYPGAADRPRLIATALGSAGRVGTAGGEVMLSSLRQQGPTATGINCCRCLCHLAETMEHGVWVPAFRGDDVWGLALRLRRDDEEENYSSFFGSFDIRSRRSCMSFI